jgi:hypothetical protein
MYAGCAVKYVTNADHLLEKAVEDLAAVLR